LGATFLPGLKVTTELPRFSSTDDAEWKSEVAAAPAILTQTGKAILTPKRVAATAVLSRQALLQSAPELDAALGRQLSKALWEQVEDAALNGDGLADNPVGIRSTAGIGSVVGGAAGALLTYQHLVDLEAAPALDNVAETETAGFLVNAATRKYLRTKARGTGLDYIWENGPRPLLGYRAAVSNLAPSDLDKGSSTGVCSAVLYSANWSELFLGVYGPGVDLTVDRVTLADVGKVRITASVYVGGAVNLPEAFACMDDALLA
jgi:HK97 family phage major capsid protein